MHKENLILGYPANIYVKIRRGSIHDSRKSHFDTKKKEVGGCIELLDTHPQTSARPL